MLVEVADKEEQFGYALMMLQTDIETSETKGTKSNWFSEDLEEVENIAQNAFSGWLNAAKTKTQEVYGHQIVNKKIVRAAGPWSDGHRLLRRHKCVDV